MRTGTSATRSLDQVLLNGDAIIEPGTRGEPIRDKNFLLLFNAHSDAVRFVLPDADHADGWHVVVDTAALPPARHWCRRLACWVLPSRTTVVVTGQFGHGAARGRRSGRRNQPGRDSRTLLGVRASLAAGPRQAEGQPEPVPDGLLDLLLAWPGVDCDDVLLAAEDVQHGIGLCVVFAEPDGTGPSAPGHMAMNLARRGAAPPHRSAGRHEARQRPVGVQAGQPRRQAYDRNSGLILVSGRFGHWGLDVIITQRKDLNADVGAVRRQLALQDQPDLLSVEVPGRVLRRVEGELDDAMRCRRINIVVRRQPPQLGRSLKSIRDQPDPLEVLVLASRC